MDEHEFSQWGPEQQEAYLAEQQAIDEVLEAIKVQKSTLKEARWRQRQIKLGRNFYPPRPYKGGKGDGRPSKGDIKCFRCGGPHYQDKCPQKFKEKSAQIEMKSQLRLPSQLLSLQAKQTIWSPIPTNCQSSSTASPILERQHR